MSTHVVIMAGGVGSRLWPLSTPQMPKQFIDVLGVGKSLIQLTAERFMPVCEPSNVWVVTSERYVDIVKKQLPLIPEDQILAEPVARNTAPCIAYACRKIAHKYPDADVAVTPADAIVFEKERFASVIASALDFVHDSASIVTVGIKPVRPETGYGYICAESIDPERVVKVSSFREKPDLETAKEYLAAGNYFWNAGIFVWNVRTINDCMRKYAPQIASVFDRIEPSFYGPEEPAVIADLFPTCDKISIDYAVMEKADNIHTISADLGWSDLGNWSAVGAGIEKDADGNAVAGQNVRLYGCKNCIVNAGDASSVAVEGLEGYIVAAMDGNILVCRTSMEQNIREYSGGN